VYQILVLLVLAGLMLFVYRAIARRLWWTLTIDETGLIFRRGQGPEKAAIRWEQVTMIGTMTSGSGTFLCAWGEGINADPSLPVRLCPLRPPHFEPAQIRAAILQYRPTVNIDPGF
jgi:hypothetical protein